MIVEGRPNEGDIIYMPLMNSFFEIQFVQDQEPFFQLGQLPVYKLRCTRWEYSNEKLDTGIAAIDGAEERYSTNQALYQTSLDSGTFSAVLGSPVVTGDQVTSIPIISGGEDYTTAPTITISAPSATINGVVSANLSGSLHTLSSFTISNPGRGYSLVPTVTLIYVATDTTTKTNSSAAVSLTNGRITAITTPTITDISSITSVSVSGTGVAVTAAAAGVLTAGVLTKRNITVNGSR